MDDQSLSTLTKGQRAAYTAAMRGFNLFLTGCGGTGKSYIAEIIIRDLLAQEKNVLVCAPTGVAAELIGGATIHRAFGLDNGVQFKKNGALKRRTPAAVMAADVIFVDEISMVRADIFDCIASSILTAAAEKGKQKQIIVSGDFYQLPPVVLQEDRPVLAQHYGQGIPWAFMGNLWRKCNFKTVILDEVLRQSDTQMTSHLNMCRLGDRSCIKYFNINASKIKTTKDMHLYAKRDDVARENAWHINALEGDAYTIPRYYRGMALNESELSEENEVLTLKPGARVLITKNDTSSPLGKRKYVNGTSAVVKGVFLDPADPMKDYVIVQLEKTREIIDIFRYKRQVYGYKEHKGKLVRYPVGYFAEMPIVPAYAMTIHKAQGQTYEYVNVDPQGCFASGQLYVALSRAKSIEGLYLDHQITGNDLIVDARVKAFYSTLIDNTSEFLPKRGRPSKPKTSTPKERKSKSEKGGRPGKYGNEDNRKSVAMKVPKEVADVLIKILDEAFPHEGQKPDIKNYEKLLRHLEKYYQIK